MKSGKIYDFLPWMSDILYAIYSFCFMTCFCVMKIFDILFDPFDQKLLSESCCFFVNEYGRLFLFCDE